MLGVVTAWLIADLGSGLIHWIEDRYGDPDWPWPIGEHIVAPNIEHHVEPHKLTRSGYLERNLTTLIPALLAAAIAAALGRWDAVAGFLWLSQANEVHSWAHQKCSRPIRILQTLGILQSPEKHAIHHRKPFDRNYCACTDWLNPVLEWFEVWDRLERVIALTTGIRPRPERRSA